MSEPDGTDVSYELWRTHARGGPDVHVQGNMPEEVARELLRAASTPDLEGFCSFYLVRATTTRSRLVVEEGAR